MFFHLFVMNQKELCVRSCLMANPDLQLLFSHTYLSFSAHPYAQSRCQCHNRAESLLLSARDCYTARSSSLASSKANQPNKKSCFLLTSDDLKPVYRLKREKKHMTSSVVCCSPCGLSSLFGERFWERKNNSRKRTIFFLLFKCSKKQQCSGDPTRNR